MQRIDLAKYKELFVEPAGAKQRSRHQSLQDGEARSRHSALRAEELENEIFQGIELTSYGVSGRGKALLPKELNKKLPYIFYEFQKMEAQGEKIEKLEENIESGKRAREYFINGRAGTKLAIGAGEIAAYAIPIQILKLTDPTNPLMFFYIPLALWSLLGFGVARDRAPYIGPLGCAKALVDKATYKTRKKSALKMAERKKTKLEKEIKAKIAQATESQMEYTKKWLKKEKKGLEEMLLSANPEFAEGFTELQKIIRPEHQLEFLKHFEGFAKQLEQESWSKEKVEQHLRRYNISEGSGIWTEEAKDAFAQQARKREKSFNMLLKPIEKLPKNPEGEKLAEQIEKTASMEYYLQGYGRISKRRKEILKEFYKQRPELAWTARGGRLDIITGDRQTRNRRERFSRRQSFANRLDSSSFLTTFYAVQAITSTNPLYPIVLGVILGLRGISHAIARKDNDAEREIRNHLREHGERILLRYRERIPQR